MILQQVGLDLHLLCQRPAAQYLGHGAAAGIARADKQDHEARQSRQSAVRNNAFSQHLHSVTVNADYG